eukprot:8638382-Karenia_brevis.AAC.1
MSKANDSALQSSRLDVQSLQRQVRDLQASLQAPAPIIDPSYDRAPNWSVLALSTQVDVPKT